MITLFKFYSPTCAPCKMMDSRLATLNDQDLIIKAIDVTDPSNKSTVEDCNIKSVPVLIITKLSELRRLEGVHPLSKVKEVINELRDL